LKYGCPVPQSGTASNEDCSGHNPPKRTDRDLDFSWSLGPRIVVMLSPCEGIHTFTRTGRPKFPKSYASRLHRRVEGVVFIFDASSIITFPRDLSRGKSGFRAPIANFFQGAKARSPGRSGRSAPGRRLTSAAVRLSMRFPRMDRGNTGMTDGEGEAMLRAEIVAGWIVFSLSAVVVAGEAQTWKQAYDGGIKHFRAQEYAEAQAAFEKALPLAQSTSEKHTTLMYLGHCRYKDKQYDDARAMYAKALDLPELSPSQKAYSHHYTAYSFYVEKKYEKAIEHYAKAAGVKDAPGSVRGLAQLSMGRSLYNMKQYEKAVEVLAEVLDIEGARPNQQSDAQLQIGNAYYQMKRFPEAESAFKKLIEMEKAHVNHKGTAQLYLGHLKRNQKDYEGARAEYLKATEMEKVPTGTIAYAHLLIGDTYRAEQNKEQAKAAYQKVIDTPNAPKSYVDRAKKNIAALGNN